MVYYFISKFNTRSTTEVNTMSPVDGYFVMPETSFKFRVIPDKVDYISFVRGEVVYYSISRNLLDQELYKVRNFLSRI